MMDHGDSTCPPRLSLDGQLRLMRGGEDPKACKLSPEEMASFKSLLVGMLAYEPLERITIKIALDFE